MRISDWSSDVCSSDLRRNDLAAGKGTDLELVVGEFGDALGDELRTAIDGVQALREAGRQAPLDLGHALRKGRSREAGGDARTEERRVGQEGVSTCRSRRWLIH